MAETLDTAGTEREFMNLKRRLHYLTAPLVLWIMAAGLVGAGELKSNVVTVGITGGGKGLRLAVNVANGDIRTEARCDDLRNRTCAETVYESKRYSAVPEADLGEFKGQISAVARVVRTEFFRG